MVDGVLLLVDAAEGPLPQTRFVLRKALEARLPPIVVINKIDRPDARPHEVLDEVYDLFIDLDATEDQLDFPVLYTNARTGTATRDLKSPARAWRRSSRRSSRTVPAPRFDPAMGLQFRVAMLDWDDYVGRLHHRPHRERRRAPGRPRVRACTATASVEPAKVTVLYGFEGLKRTEIAEASAGDLVAIAGIESIEIGDTIADLENPVALPRIRIDEPTVSMMFSFNDSPFAGKEGKFVTSTPAPRAPLEGAPVNVAHPGRGDRLPDTFRVSGRGELQLAILIETMRREGYELEVGKPEIITHQKGGRALEPMEHLVIDIPEEYIGAVTEKLGPRRAA